MKKYPKYKDSGIEWIGKIPEHWELMRLKWIINERLKYGANEAADLDDRKLPRYIRITDFGEDGKLREDTFKSLPYDASKEYLLKDGDILFARSGATVGKTFQFKNYTEDACFAGYLIKASPDETKVLSDFLYYFTKSNSYENWKDSVFIQSTIQNISADKYQLLDISLPTIDEQEKIIVFIDQKTKQIDTLIEKKQKLIDLLKEQRTAIINQAVTKGLDPNVPMKDSGIEWLGEIPEHWEVKPLKFIKSKDKYAFVDGPFGSNLKSIHFIANGDVYVIESGFITSGEFKIKDFKTITREHFETIKRSECKAGDIIIAKIGANFGMSGILPELDKDAVVSGNSLKLTVDADKNLKEFIHFQLLSLKFQGAFDLLVNMTAQPALSLQALNSLCFAVPKKEEQEKIVTYLNEKLKCIDKSIASIKKQIELQKEYRTTLISEVVTGKIDVRNEKE